MSDGDVYDDPYAAELLEDQADAYYEQPVEVGQYATYQRWDPISERTYPGVSIVEFAVKGDESSERYYSQYPESFEHDMKVLTRMYGAQSVNFRVVAADYEAATQVDVKLRVDVDDGGLDDIAEHIASSTAPRYGRGTGSDNVTGLHIFWKLGWVQLIIQPPANDGVTVIVGSTGLFPGYVTKIINTVDHGVNYSATDCAFICLNEATGMRYSPVDIRNRLFRNRNALTPIDIKKDMVRIANCYNCSVLVHSLDDNSKFVTSRDRTLPLVQLVRMGLAIGIIDHKVEIVDSPPTDGPIAHAYYDLESVSNSTSTQVYSFSCIWINGEPIQVLHHDPNVVASSIRDAIKDMLDATPAHIKTIHLHAWNGSRFDHPLLLNISNERFKLGFVIMNSEREVLSANMHYNGRTIVLRDPCKMMPMTLREGCELFGLESSKLDIPHNVIETAFINGQLQQYLQQHRDGILEYNMRDTLLAKQLTESIMQVYASSGIEYNKHLTRSMASHAMWVMSLTDQDKNNLMSIQFSYNDTLRFTHCNVTIEQVKDEAIAGRVQCFRGEYRDSTLLDYKSHYPSVATSEQYPCGNYFSTTEYVPGKLGLYIVKVLRQTHPHVVPFRENKRKPYDWSYGGMICKLLTSVDVECLIEGESEFIIEDGIYWESSTNYFSNHMVQLFNNRNQCRKGGYETMAEHFKAMANALTGAIFQQLRREYVHVFSNKNEADIYMKMHGKYIQMTYELTYDNGQIMLFFYPKKLADANDIEIQKKVCKGSLSTKPVILTMFIYAYGRAKLWRGWRKAESTGMFGVVYCDTDSLAVVPRTIGVGTTEQLLNIFSGQVGDQMGMLEVVMSNANMVAVSPKVYAMINDSKERVRVKGVSGKDTLYLISRDMKGVASIIRENGWEHAKMVNNTPIGKSHTTLCYNTVRELLNNKVILSAHWYFQRMQGSIQKKYTVTIVEAH